MSLPWHLRVPVAVFQPMPQRLDEPLELPPAMEFQLQRRMVVGYVCEACLEMNLPLDQCRSPEWEWNDANVSAGVPEEVVHWAEQHAYLHMRIEESGRRKEAARR
jgi:hypothetical protein